MNVSRSRTDLGVVRLAIRIVGSGYGRSGEKARAYRVDFADPVYAGKAMAGMTDLIQQGIFSKDENVLFIHTGRSPALYHNLADVLN